MQLPCFWKFIWIHSLKNCLKSTNISLSDPQHSRNFKKFRDFSFNIVLTINASNIFHFQGEGGERSIRLEDDLKMEEKVSYLSHSFGRQQNMCICILYFLCYIYNFYIIYYFFYYIYIYVYICR